jgi:flavin-binding protein dodecin
MQWLSANWRRTGCLFPVALQQRRFIRRPFMSESVYKVIELIGTSDESWEKAAAAAVNRAAQSLHNLRIAEVVELDMTIDDGAVALYRAKVRVSFKYKDDD